MCNDCRHFVVTLFSVVTDAGLSVCASLCNKIHPLRNSLNYRKTGIRDNASWPNAGHILVQQNQLSNYRMSVHLCVMVRSIEVHFRYSKSVLL